MALAVFSFRALGFGSRVFERRIQAAGFRHSRDQQHFTAQTTLLFATSVTCAGHGCAYEGVLHAQIIGYRLGTAAVSVYNRCHITRL